MFKLNFAEKADSVKRQLELLTQESSANEGSSCPTSQESYARGECEDERDSDSSPETSKINDEFD